MKTLLLLATTMLLAIPAATAQFTKAELLVNGLTCSMCSLATQKQLQTIDFIDSIGTDLNHTTYLLYFKKDANVNTDLIKKKVEDAGFSVGSLQLTISVNALPTGYGNQFNYHESVYYMLGDMPKVINGDIRLKVVDNGFVTAKEFKTYKKYAGDFPSLLTGKTSDGKRAYHLIAI